MYNLILKELKKGNSILIEVDDLNMSIYKRYRLLTPKSCKFDWIQKTNGNFINSCFLDYFKFIDINPDLIILQMKKYDSINSLKIQIAMIIETGKMLNKKRKIA